MGDYDTSASLPLAVLPMGTAPAIVPAKHDFYKIILYIYKKHIID